MLCMEGGRAWSPVVEGGGKESKASPKQDTPHHLHHRGVCGVRFGGGVSFSFLLLGVACPPPPFSRIEIHTEEHHGVQVCHMPGYGCSYCMVFPSSAFVFPQIQAPPVLPSSKHTMVCQSGCLAFSFLLLLNQQNCLFLHTTVAFLFGAFLPFPSNNNNKLSLPLGVWSVCSRGGLVTAWGLQLHCLCLEAFFLPVFFLHTCQVFLLLPLFCPQFQWKLSLHHALSHIMSSIKACHGPCLIGEGHTRVPVLPSIHRFSVSCLPVTITIQFKQTRHNGSTRSKSSNYNGIMPVCLSHLGQQLGSFQGTGHNGTNKSAIGWLGVCQTNFHVE